MSRWTIEKSSIGIEKSGTGIEKSGTGIEKSGTGIEKSGTGIEKSGTGIRKSFLALSLASIAFASQVNANQLDPEGSVNLVVQNNTILISWIVDGSVFSGVSTLNGSAFRLPLTEISLAKPDVTGERNSKKVTGGGTGIEITGGGTGTEITGGGTGIEITGGGTGIEITGGGTGTEITGGGTGTEITGGGTGTEITGGGTGTEITGGGTGIERIAITLPSYTGLEMDIVLGCETASISIIDSNFVEVAFFSNVKVMGDTGLCQDAANDTRSRVVRSPMKKAN